MKIYDNELWSSGERNAMEHERQVNSWESGCGWSVMIYRGGWKNLTLTKGTTFTKIIALFSIDGGDKQMMS